MYVSKLLVERIEGAPVLGERKSYISAANNEMFYFN